MKIKKERLLAGFRYIRKSTRQEKLQRERILLGCKYIQKYKTRAYKEEE